MTSVPRDNNQIATMNGILNTDGVTSTPVQSNPSTHLIMIADGSTGAVTASADARRDSNSVTTLLAYASNGSGPVELAVNSSGQLLVQST